MTVTYHSGGRFQGIVNTSSSTSTTSSTNVDWNETTKLLCTVGSSNEITSTQSSSASAYWNGTAIEGNETVVIQSGASAEVSYKPDQSLGNHNTHIGLELAASGQSMSDSASGGSGTKYSILFNIHGSSTRWIHVYVDGVDVWNASTSWSNNSTVGKIVVDGTSVKFYKDATLLYTKTGATTGTYKPRVYGGWGTRAFETKTTGFSVTTTTITPDYDTLTNVPDYSRFEETDTRKIYTKFPYTFSDDFSTDKGWLKTGSDVSIDSTTNNRLDFNIPNTVNQTDAITYDLTSVSDSAWVLRFKFVMDIYSQNTTGYAKKLCIGLSSTSHSTDIDSAQDAIGILFGSWDNGTHKIRSRDSNGGSWMGGAGTDFSEAFTDDEVYYVEIKRTLTTAYTVSLYSDSTYSTLIEAESETMGATDTTGLRYLKIGIDTTGSTPSGTFTGYIDDIKFYNGATDTTSTTSWKEKGTT